MFENFNRPVVADNTRLFYRTNYKVQQGKVGGIYRGHLYIPPASNSERGLFRLMDPDNILAVMRLYRFFYKESIRVQEDPTRHPSGMILKDVLMRQIFEDSPQVNKHRVGRLLRMIVQYEVNFQKNRCKNTSNRNLQFWRWCHPLDFVYGLEFLMTLWLPRAATATGSVCETVEDFEEELEAIINQTKEDDHEFISMIVKKRLY